MNINNNEYLSNPEQKKSCLFFVEFHFMKYLQLAPCLFAFAKTELLKYRAK